MHGVLNLPLAARLAGRTLRQRRAQSLATMLGVAVGMMVVGCILIVDYNSASSRAAVAVVDAGPTGPQRDVEVPRRHEASEPRLLAVVVARSDGRGPDGAILPTQEGGAPESLAPDRPPRHRRGEEDYQAMRLAVRLASALAFSVGAIIVFFTLRFSVAARSREFSLLLCLGEHRANVALSLGLQALAFGVLGSAAGLLLAFPVAYSLLGLDISTTGRVPLRGFRVPWPELLAMTGISVGVALLGVVGPVRGLYRLSVIDVLQPRFLSVDVGEREFRVRSFGWLIPALLATAYLSVRPFLESWLTVVQFFAAELAFLGLLAVATLWAIPAILRFALRVFESVLQPLFRLEALLVGRRMRLTSQKIVFTIAGVAIVFSLLTALHGVTGALKREADAWAREASDPYAYYGRREPRENPIDETQLRSVLDRERIQLFRLSAKLPGEFPIRLIRASDLNPLRLAQGRKPLEPGRVILSRTLAARFDADPGDSVRIRSDSGEHRFEIIDVADDVGFYAENGPYVDLKSFALMSDGNPLFAGHLERTLDRYAMARSADAARPLLSGAQHDALSPYYILEREGRSEGRGRVGEIDRDFLIFDFILAMTAFLAAIGVANNMLIQVHARQRELSVLRTVGIGPWGNAKLLLVEGAIVGLVAAALALPLGNAIGALSVSFLDRFTLFDYGFRFSLGASALLSSLAVITCALAAIHPAVVAAKLPSAEYLHYE